MEDQAPELDQSSVSKGVPLVSKVAAKAATKETPKSTTATRIQIRK